MKKLGQISLIPAILINVNIMIGAGLFINTRPLTQFAGYLGFTAYLLGTLLLLPIIATVAELASYYPSSGGLYVYSASTLHPLAGFISGWGYFLGKTTSAAMMCHIFVVFLQQRSMLLASLPTLMLDALLLFGIVALNSGGVTIGGIIQHIFITFKLLPIIAVVITGIVFFTKGFDNGFMQATPPIELTSYLLIVPIGLYALLGFEATCSIAHLIKSPETNAKRAIFTSFLFVAAVATTFQFFMYLVMGSDLSHLPQPFEAFINSFLPGYAYLGSLLGICVLVSVIGSAFGILTSNAWNLFTLAENNLLPFRKTLTRLNKGKAPWISLFVEAAIGFVILIAAQEQVALQSMAVLAIFISYLFASISGVYLSFMEDGFRLNPLIPLTAFCIVTAILFLCVRTLMEVGLSYAFTFFLFGGIAVAFIQFLRLGIEQIHE